MFSLEPALFPVKAILGFATFFETYEPCIAGKLG